MRFASAASAADSAPEVLREVLDGIGPGLGAEPDLAVLFVTAALGPETARLAEEIRRELRPKVLLGVTCEGVIGAEVEIERREGAALLTASLPGVDLRPFHIGTAEWRDLLPDDERLQQRVGTGERHAGQLILGDPFTTPVDPLLARLDEVLRAPTFGGMASGGMAPGANTLILDDAAYTEGAVGLGIGGEVRLETVVSQGCRPVGRPVVVTETRDEWIVELGRRPALEAAEEMLRSLPVEDLQLVQAAGLFAGVVINEYQAEFRRGDFLIRNLMAVDRESSAFAVGDHVRPGQTIQFHVRDRETAHEDLTELLRPQAEGERPAGGFLFSCNGRGARLFGEPHHDIRTAHAALPDVPLAGFFAMGELGPVGGRSFIHGHTASLALFRPA